MAETSKPLTRKFGFGKSLRKRTRSKVASRIAHVPCECIPQMGSMSSFPCLGNEANGKSLDRAPAFHVDIGKEPVVVKPVICESSPIVKGPVWTGTVSGDVASAGATAGWTKARGRVIIARMPGKKIAEEEKEAGDDEFNALIDQWEDSTGLEWDNVLEKSIAQDLVSYSTEDFLTKVNERAEWTRAFIVSVMLASHAESMMQEMDDEEEIEKMRESHSRIIATQAELHALIA